MVFKQKAVAGKGKKIALFISLFLFCPLVCLLSQTPPLSIISNNAEKYQIHIKRTLEPLTLDGQLTEKTWQSAETALNFWQQKPVDDKLASRRTEVRLAYDDYNLYITATYFDSLPYFIGILKRDNYGMSDEFSVLTDPNSQKANGFGFGVNVMNAQTEVLLTTGNADATWDNKWSSHVSRYADKWIVEMAIPFKTLRFKDGNNQWGIQFARNVTLANVRSEVVMKCYF